MAADEGAERDGRRRRWWKGARVRARRSHPDSAITSSAAQIEFEHEVEDTEKVAKKFKDFLDHVTPEDFAGE